MAQEDANSIFSTVAVCVLFGTLMNIDIVGLTGAIGGLVALYFASAYIAGFHSQTKKKERRPEQ